MQQYYRIIVSPYNYDYWDIFTESKEVFEAISCCDDVDDAREHFGNEQWEQLVDTWIMPSFPYIILGESNLRQRD